MNTALVDVPLEAFNARNLRVRRGRGSVGVQKENRGGRKVNSEREEQWWRERCSKKDGLSVSRRVKCENAPQKRHLAVRHGQNSRICRGCRAISWASRPGRGDKSILSGWEMRKE